MSAHPPAPEVLAAAMRFLRDQVAPTLKDDLAFNMRVTLGALELVRREIEQAESADAREHARLAHLLGEGDLETQREALCDRIAAGELTLDDPALREHLRATAIDRLAIDQPTYSAYLAATKT